MIYLIHHQGQSHLRNIFCAISCVLESVILEFSTGDLISFILGDGLFNKGKGRVGATDFLLIIICFITLLVNIQFHSHNFCFTSICFQMIHYIFTLKFSASRTGVSSTGTGDNLTLSCSVFRTSQDFEDVNGLLFPLSTTSHTSTFTMSSLLDSLKKIFPKYLCIFYVFVCHEIFKSITIYIKWYYLEFKISNRSFNKNNYKLYSTTSDYKCLQLTYLLYSHYFPIYIGVFQYYLCSDGRILIYDKKHEEIKQ
ncbi:hypothetical protein AGLY_008536 [Aphis glycines]|uniref:Uncharacterized protein n=1 Tax=Aphis glycines TaxID=307491 RepID=A0A6G0TLJ7_APHGL|nr:hypothetical protein AGLY_008536 [Aphis glycines]